MGNRTSRHMLSRSEQDGGRQELQHILIRRLIHGNYHAPMEEALERGIKVLDVGCGSGNWALDMAVDYPLSQFVGTDAAKVFPRSSSLPNCSFVQANTLKGLPFPDNTFDYVFQRLFMLTFTKKDWATAAAELIRVTKPGGWIELLEFDFNLQRLGPSSERILKASEPTLNFTSHTLPRNQVTDINEAKGIYLGSTEPLDRFAASLENVNRDYVTTALGWNGNAGELSSQNWQGEILEMKEKLATELDMSEPKFGQLVAKAVVEFAEQKTWAKMPYLYGMKPLPQTKQ